MRRVSSTYTCKCIKYNKSSRRDKKKNIITLLFSYRLKLVTLHSKKKVSTDKLSCNFPNHL